MNSSFDDLWEQSGKSSQENAIKKKSSFDELWEQSEQPIKQERSTLEKGGRLAGQYGLGILQGTPAGMAYDISTTPLASKEAQNVPYREDLGEELDQLMHQKASGQWTDEDEMFLKHIEEQIKDPNKSMEFAQTADIGIRGLAEKATGVDLHPEGFLEKAANWAGIIKDPKKIKELATSGVNFKNILKSVKPSPSEATRGITTGIALEMAEQNQFGPIGTIAAAVVGDVFGGGIGKLPEQIKKFAEKPKEMLAKGFAKFTPKDKIDLQQQIIKDFREAGIQADIGTITNSNFLKNLQSRLEQSSLTGKALEDFKKQMTNDIKGQYKKLADQLGKHRFETAYEAGEVGREYLNLIRDAEKAKYTELYSGARDRIAKGGENAVVNPSQLAFQTKELEKSLKPGAIKSTEQNAVLGILDDLKKDILDSKGKIKHAKVQDLINDKIALNDIINYEVQGGQKQLLKKLNEELDKTIKSYGQKDPSFAKLYDKAQKDFGEHAKIFRNENISKILRSHDPQVLMNKMNTVQGLKDLGMALGKSPEGKKLFGDLKRFKLDQMIGNKMVDNVSQQLKTGTFANLLKSPKDLQIVKELLGAKNLVKLQNLQKVTGHIHEAAYKFFNASKSASVAIDAAIITKGLNDFASILSGNPWPLLKTGGVIAGSKYATRLMADTSFLQMVEKAVLASKKEDMNLLLKLGPGLEESIRAAIAYEIED